MKNKVKLALSLVAVSLSFQAKPESCGFNLEVAEEVASCPNEYPPVVPTGKINPEKLIAEQEEFRRYYQSYQVDTDAVSPLRQLSIPTEIVVIIATWCPDCHRETPRFMRIMEAIDNPDIHITYIAVDRNKKDEEGLAAQYEFSRIPTFIVMQNGLEVGRIVERPLVSLEKGLVDILK
ncbi:thioredoxin family protein [Endozoicomonas atrinae]|uniref:thioredoxin family protein n=1 Tax=Endozoicomonas atrinae TaxID=1333660 RepID=UPI000825AFB0|nr:thioredoxin family protein [Endozoicomonas atrinae]